MAPTTKDFRSPGDHAQSMPELRHGGLVATKKFGLVKILPLRMMRMLNKHSAVASKLGLTYVPMLVPNFAHWGRFRISRGRSSYMSPWRSQRTWQRRLRPSLAWHDLLLTFMSRPPSLHVTGVWWSGRAPSPAHNRPADSRVPSPGVLDRRES